MNWNNFKTYGESPEKAFETLCNQLFERFLIRNYSNDLIKFRVINGAGGDGGIEAYGELRSGEIIAVQAKYFRQNLKVNQISQIKNSIITAKKLRKNIQKYIICVPHDVSSLKIDKNNVPTKNHEEIKIDSLTDEINILYPDLKLIWWFDDKILGELQLDNNDGINKYWFEKDVISLEYLSSHFDLQKKGWLKERYISELHGQGVIYDEYNKICFNIKYRIEFLTQLKEAFNDLQDCIYLIEQFVPTNDTCFLNMRLLVIKRNLTLFLNEIRNMSEAAREGNDLYKSQKISEVEIWKTKAILEKLNATNIQKNILPKLISSLNHIHGYFLPQYIESIALYYNQGIRLVLGEYGTGKTHGLTNCVEAHLKSGSPALIIQAKGGLYNNWTEILSNALELKNWTKTEILLALESCAVRNDIKNSIELNSGEELKSECSKILICVDGMEEDVENYEEWYRRIRESEQLVTKFPRLKFIFSARNYFQSNIELPEKKIFDTVYLPREGDVSVYEVAQKYFSKDHYNIQLSSIQLLKGLDNLFALRLFCEQYRDSVLTNNDTIKTATRDLLNVKIDRLNSEFASYIKPKRLSDTRIPVTDALVSIANYFYSNVIIEHNQLFSLIQPKLNYLDNTDIDALIDYLSKNGFLIKSEKIDNSRTINGIKHFYNITYQSIIEHILSEDIYYTIKTGSANKIPPILHHGMIRPLDYSPKKIDEYKEQPNQRIIQNIINNLFVETGRLIGENSFLITGFDDEQILKMQMEALIHSPSELAREYKNKIDAMFYGGFETQHDVLKYLIIPSSRSNENYYGAEYLHQILFNQASAFERDKLWSGLDNYEKRILSEEKRFKCQYINLYSAYDELGIGKVYLSEDEKHNEKPLVLAWGLSSINQELREILRVALTEWAIKCPKEFILLLDKIFFCNDPQIQEDLSSIMLGVATKLKDKNHIKELSDWTISNIFSNIEKYRNVVIRQGFRSIVEKAFLFETISGQVVEKCRPQILKTILVLPLDENYLKSPHEEFYPIVHDLAWYVIKYAYSGFLEHPSFIRDKLEDNNCMEGTKLLASYNIKDFSATLWVMSAAIAYIRSLGLTREQGNGMTDETHGSKSKIFTYEEKYTWLAVHYLQGYLSDYIPHSNFNDKREFIKNYAQLSDMHNPSEDILDIEDYYEDFEIGFSKDWIVKESLTYEFKNDANIQNNITQWVNEEYNYDFKKWLLFDSKDFNICENDNKWVSIYNRTTLYDSQSFTSSYIDAKACLISKADLNSFLTLILNHSVDLDFISEFDSLVSYPKTDTYCNPSDIVWMNWIDEENQTQEFYDNVVLSEKKMYNTITKVIKKTIGEEKHFIIPSKKIRKLLDINELKGNKFFTSKNQLVAFNHELWDEHTYDAQKMTLIDNEVLKNEMEKINHEMVWFVELLKQRNPSNKKLSPDFFPQKVRKYLVWLDNGEFKSMKIWDSRFSNTLT